MSSKFIGHYPLASTTWDNDEILAIDRVVKSQMFTMGKEVENFEKKFAKFFNSKFALMVNSGSSANLIAIAALFYTKIPKLKKGDEVIVPAVSWPTTYYPLQQYGLKIKFVDINLETLNMDLNQLEKAISPKTKLIFSVNLLGNPNEFSEIQKLAIKYNLLVIEDNCESMGATYKGKYAGAIGLMGTFSSFFSHHISTMEGGMLITDDEELYHVMLCLRAHGWTRNLPTVNLVTGEKSPNMFEESFKFVLPGYNFRPLEMSGAIGQEQLKKLPAFLEQRRKNAKLFQSIFNDHPFIAIQREVEQSSWFAFSLIIKEHVAKSRSDFANFLTSKKIECRPIVAGNFAKNSVLKYFDYEISGDLNNANIIDQRGIFVGNHHFNMEQHIVYLKECVDEFFGN